MKILYDATPLLMRSAGMGAVCSVPLASRGHSVGALVCEWSESRAFDAVTRERVREVGMLCGPILAVMSRAEAGFYRLGQLIDRQDHKRGQ